MARVNEGSHSFTCHPHVYPQTEWAILPWIPSRRASPHFGLHSLPVPQRVTGWVGLGGWLHTEMVSLHRRRSPIPAGPVTRLKLSMGPIRGPYSLYPRHVRASMLPKKETKYSYNAFQARDKRDKCECDSAVYSSFHGIQGCHLVFFDFLIQKNT